MTTLRRHAVTLIPGDGVGPEVALAAKRVLDAAAATAGVAFDWEEAEAGAEVFKKGDTSGVPAATRDSIERTRVALKGPLETPLGIGGAIEGSAGAPLKVLQASAAAQDLPSGTEERPKEGEPTAAAHGELL